MCIALRNSFVLLLFAWTAAIAAPATDKDMKVDLVQDLNWQEFLHHRSACFQHRIASEDEWMI